MAGDDFPEAISSPMDRNHAAAVFVIDHQSFSNTAEVGADGAAPHRRAAMTRAPPPQWMKSSVSGIWRNAPEYPLSMQNLANGWKSFLLLGFIKYEIEDGHTFGNTR